MKSEGLNLINPEKPEESKEFKLTRTQKLIEFLVRKENNLVTEITDDTLSAKSAIQYSGFKLPVTVVMNDDDDDNGSDD
jgi:hypothetical protein